MIERGKLQAIYNYLPGMWVSLQTKDGQPIVVRITAWNHRPMPGIYSSFIENEIRHRIRSFADQGGDSSSFPLDRDKLFSFEEISGNEEVGDIICTTSPLFFYCDRCGKIEQRKSGDKNLPVGNKCHTCKKGIMKQLQFVYSCSCGYAKEVFASLDDVKNYYYFTTEKRQQYTLSRKDGSKGKELVITCPNCNTRLYPDNASSKHNFKQQSVTVVNLVDAEAGKFFDRGDLAHKAVICRWFGILSEPEYSDIIENQDVAFQKKIKLNPLDNLDKEGLRTSLDSLGLCDDKLQMIFDALNKNFKPQPDVLSMEDYASSCDALLIDQQNALGTEGYREWIGRLAFKLIQYYTIRDSNHKSLADCLEDMKRYDVIENDEEVCSLQNKLGISDMLVTNDVELVTCVYGYTRKTEDPASRNISGRLKLNSFGSSKDGLLISYGAKLKTEGILFDISQRKIIEWLYENRIIEEYQVPDLDDDTSVKRWFLEHVKGVNISSFGNSQPSDLITDAVFSLLHSISHAFLIQAGEMSGLETNSLSELIIVETASIFIYSQSEQGITLGALSSMANLGYAKYLKEVMHNSRNCVFDPICLEAETCCSACQLLPENCCKYFNHNLGRKYLYSLSSSQHPSIGFWDMK